MMHIKQGHFVKRERLKPFDLNTLLGTVHVNIQINVHVTSITVLVNGWRLPFLLHIEHLFLYKIFRISYRN